MDVYRTNRPHLQFKELKELLFHVGINGTTISSTHSTQIQNYLNKNGKTEWKPEMDSALQKLSYYWWKVRVWLSDFIPNTDTTYKTLNKINQSLNKTLCVLYDYFVIGEGENFIKSHFTNYMNIIYKKPEVANLPDLFYGCIRRRINLRRIRAYEGDRRCIKMFSTFQLILNEY